jgi:Domain of unknown function (DUF4184)
MPFTFSHPAIVLPFVFLPRKWFSLTGLVVGSLTPDFEYFLRMKVVSLYSHTLGGLFWFDIPLGILIAFTFHNIVRDSFFENLPSFLQSRLVKYKNFDWNNYFKKNWIVVIISILIGSFSHIFWDGFTHSHGYFVEIIPDLRNIETFFSIQIPVFKILQHSSSLVGGILVSYSLLKLKPELNFTKQMSIKYWSTLIVSTLIIIIFRLLCGLDYMLYGHVIVTAISACLISLILVPFCVRKK